MATPNRWAIREAGEATFYSLVNGKAIVTLKSLKTSGVETTGETVYARGGRGNVKIVGFSSNREARLTLEDAIFDNEAIAMLTGNSPSRGKRVIDYREEKAVDTGEIALSKTPVGALISVYKLNADGTNGEEYLLGDPLTGSNEYDISGKVLTFGEDVEDGAMFRVYYKVETDETATTIKVTSDAFGGTFKIALDVLVRDEYTKQDYAGQIIVHNGKFEDNFNIDLAADGDPATLTLPIEVLKSPTSTDMWELVIYDEELVS